MSWAKARQITIKIGSSLLIDKQTGEVDHAFMEGLVSDVVALKKAGKAIMIVSSGAVGLGRAVLGLPSGPLVLAKKQAAARHRTAHLNARLG